MQGPAEHRRAAQAYSGTRYPAKQPVQRRAAWQHAQRQAQPPRPSASASDGCACALLCDLTVGREFEVTLPGSCLRTALLFCLSSETVSEPAHRPQNLPDRR